MRYIRYLTIILVVTAFSQCKSVKKIVTKKNSPNILFIYADDMGYGDLAIQNPDSKIPTPHLDLLASQGMRFSDAHSSSAICTPSRYAVLTGRYHWRQMHDIVKPFNASVFDEGRLTVPQMLKDKGYKTACIGKWHLGWDWSDNIKPEAKEVNRVGYLADDIDWTKAIKNGPTTKGFDYYFGEDVINFPPYAWIENDKVTEIPTQAFRKPPGVTVEGRWECRPGPMVKDWDITKVLPTVTDKAVSYIKTHDEKERFFLYFSLPSPHAPILPDSQFVDKSNAGLYGDYIVQTDWCVGQVLEALEAKGLTDNTLVIFSSDNGPENYATRRIRNHKHNSSGAFRGLKRELWEGGHRIPFIVKWPNKIAPNTISNQTINQVDLMASLAALVKYDLPNEAAEDSYNLLPLWVGERKDTTNIREASIHNTIKDHYAIRKDDWLMIDYHNSAKETIMVNNSANNQDRRSELYQLSTDTLQRNNVMLKNPEIIEEMRALLDKYKSEGRSVQLRKLEM